MAKIKSFFLAIGMIFAVTAVFAQMPSQKEQIRIQIWADLDPFPGIFEESEFPEEKDSSGGENESAEDSDKDRVFEQLFGYAIERAGQIAPYLLSGMLNGFEFDYTPSDKRRKVEEYWEFEQILPFNYSMNHIDYRAPQILEDRLVVWVYCDRNEAQKQLYNQWNSITYPHVKGKGTGSVEKGFEGIKEACSEAAKDAVREYWRIHVKNKPREIAGKMLLVREPRVYIREGQYVVDLDFFLETDTMSQYKYY